MGEVRVDVRIEKLSKLIHSDENPRLIKNKKHQQLMQSLKDLPEMKLLREIIVDENMMILAGDKRAYALEELGYTDVTIKQVFGLSEAKKREFIVKDNVHSGDWDTDALANGWDADQLKDWGVPDFRGGKDDESEGEHSNTSKDREVGCPNCGHTFPLSESISEN